MNTPAVETAAREYVGHTAQHRAEEPPDIIAYDAFLAGVKWARENQQRCAHGEPVGMPCEHCRT